MSNGHLAASSNGHAEIIQLLVDAGADINAVTDDGRTPLMQAAIQGHVDCVKTLLRNKADASIKDADGKMPVEKTEVREVIEALEGPPEKKARTE